MRLFGDANPAPNPRRVRIFIAEKGIDLPETRVHLMRGEHKSPEHKARNSLGQLPTLELDDGEFISESVSICRYLEGLFPDPPLFGRNPKESALIDMWIRRIELRIMQPAGQYWVHAHPRLAAMRKEDYTEWGEANAKIYAGALRWFDKELAGRTFVAGEAFSMADIIGLTTLDFGDFLGLAPPPECASLLAWRARVAARPSAAA